MRFLLGVDEAGRGPLAGPVAVGVVAVPEGFDVAQEFPDIADSKKLSEKKREEFFTLLEVRVRAGDVRFVVEFEDAEMIDKEGITSSVQRALMRGVTMLAPNASSVRIQLDGALSAPHEYTQETVIHGDALIPIISLASIAAKVTRDRLMARFATQYPFYGFEKHKGYGTQAHYEMLKKYGPCAIHRRSFIHTS